MGEYQTRRRNVKGVGRLGGGFHAPIGSFKTRERTSGKSGVMADQDFVPALGKAELTGEYDRVIAVMTRERRWRAALLRELDPKDRETIVDVGSGTSSQAILIKHAAPNARVIGLDPDPVVLDLARAKVRGAGVEIEFVQGMGDQAHVLIGSAMADAVVSSLVLHQCPLPAKIAILESMFQCLKPGGRLRIADFGLQRGLLMSMLFRQVRMLDGFENTKANKDGRIPELISAAGFIDVAETSSIATPTGSISLYRARKPA